MLPWKPAAKHKGHANAIWPCKRPTGMGVGIRQLIRSINLSSSHTMSGTPLLWPTSH